MREDIFTLLNKYVSISRETCERLSKYHELLLKWQPAVNLVGPDTIGGAWTRHFLDSLQLLKYIKNLSARIVDLGSGAGFPGMALAIAGASDVHLIESDAKKITFLKEAARITNTKISIHHNRIEECTVNQVDIIVSRACSSLDTLLSFSSLLVSHETTCLFHKGKNYSKEIDDAKEHWLFDCTVLPSVTDSQGVILNIENLRKRGVDREPKERKP